MSVWPFVVFICSVSLVRVGTLEPSTAKKGQVQFAHRLHEVVATFPNGLLQEIGRRDDFYLLNSSDKRMR